MSDRRARLVRALGAGDHLRFVRAPGRVNLIGGQVDYHEGELVAAAIDRDVVLGWRPRDDGRVRVRSLDLGGVVDVDPGGSPAGPEPAWGATVGAVVQALGARGRPPVGIDAAVASTLPIGAGLSSSAAFEVALALALGDAARWARPTTELARACQEAEHAASGVRCGIQDQMVSLAGVAGHAVLLDCRSLDVEALPVPDDLRVLVVHSGVRRDLADSGWDDRRRESLAVAAALGLPTLRDATADQVAAHRRGRHVVSELARVRAFATALRVGDHDALGPLLLASHASSRDDMEVSTPELDVLVELLVEEGAVGARLTGGGFGGCVVALVPADDAGRVARRVRDRYRSATGREPTPFVVRAARGAGPIGAADGEV